MLSASTNIKSSESSEKNFQSKKRNISLPNNIFKNKLYKSPSKNINALYHINNFQSGLSVNRNKIKGPRVTSMIQFQEEKKLKEIEREKKIYIKEMEKIIAHKLNENLRYLESQKKQEFLIKNKIIKSKSKRIIKGNASNSIGKMVPPKPLIIINENNYHENAFLMSQANKNQIYEITQKINEKKLEKKERLKIIKNEYIQIRKMIENERTYKNLLKNEYDLNLRRKLIENKIQIRDLNVSQNRKRKNEINNNKRKMNKILEEEKLDAIKKLKETEEKDRINYYNALIRKDKEKEQKKLESSEEKKKIYDVYDEFIKKRSANFKKIKNFINDKIDENNAEKFISLFPENNNIKEMIEKYKKLKVEIQTLSGNNHKKKLILIKPRSSFEISDIHCPTSNNFRSRTIKIKKHLIESKSKDNIKKNENNINYSNNEKNRIINFYATKNTKSNKQFEKEKEKEGNENFKNIINEKGKKEL